MELLKKDKFCWAGKKLATEEKKLYDDIKLTKKNIYFIKKYSFDYLRKKLII